MSIKNLFENWNQFINEQDDISDDEVFDDEVDAFDDVEQPRIKTNKTRQTSQAKKKKSKSQPKAASVAAGLTGKSLSPEKETKKDKKIGTGETIVIKTTKTGDGYSRSTDRNRPMDTSHLKNTKWVGIINAVNIHDRIKSAGLGLEIFKPQRNLGFGHPVTFEVLAQAHRKTMAYRGNKPNPLVGNISHITGGPQKQAGRQFSRSHQQGLDIDIGYYTTSVTNTINQPHILTNERSFYKEFDLERNLIFLHDLSKNPDIKLVLVGKDYKKRILKMLAKRKRQQPLVKQRQPSRNLQEQLRQGSVTLSPDTQFSLDKDGALRWEVSFQDINHERLFLDYYVKHSSGVRWKLLSEERGELLSSNISEWEQVKESIANFLEDSGVLSRTQNRLTTNLYPMMAEGFRALENPIEKEDSTKSTQKTKDAQGTESKQLDLKTLLRMAQELNRSSKISEDKKMHHQDHIHIRAKFPSNTITDKQYLKLVKNQAEPEPEKTKVDPESEQIKNKVSQSAKQKVEELKKEFKKGGRKGIGFVFGKINGDIIDSYNEKELFYGASMNKTMIALAQLITYKNEPKKQLTDTELNYILAYKGKSFSETYRNKKGEKKRRYVTPGTMANRINRRITSRYKGSKIRYFRKDRSIGRVNTAQIKDALNDVFNIKKSKFEYGGKGPNQQTAEDTFNFFATLERMDQMKDKDFSNVTDSSLNKEERFYKKYKQEIDKVIAIQKKRDHNDRLTKHTKSLSDNRWGKGGKALLGLNIAFVVDNSHVMVIYTKVDDGPYRGGPGDDAPEEKKRKYKRLRNKTYTRGYQIINQLLDYFSEMM